jgi:hypothetical protein
MYRTPFRLGEKERENNHKRNVFKTERNAQVYITAWFELAALFISLKNKREVLLNMGLILILVM